jgi:hypothetical protein
MRIDTSKLKVNSTKGVELLLTSLGGIWGKSNLEEKFERFERAIFSTVQKADESHESYLARHDNQFEELLQMGVGIQEVRAYILLRNPGLNSEDKKRLIVDANGDLEYKKVVSALKQLGSKFFHEVQTGNKTSFRSKTYDVNAVIDDEPSWGHYDEEPTYVGEAWDESELPYDEGDPDALVCMQFEESILEALQADTDLASCYYSAYLDAPKRLSDRTKNRGFWSGSKGSYGNPKGKGKGKYKGSMKFRKPLATLAQRILESECRRCRQRGHWKAECPLNRAQSSSTGGPSKEGGAFTGMTMVNGDDELDDMILIELEHAVPCLSRSQVAESHDRFCFVAVGDKLGHNMNPPTSLSTSMMSRFVQSVKDRLSPQPRTAVEPHSKQIQLRSSECALFVSYGPYGIVDLGASQTVIGEQQVSELLKHLPEKIQRSVKFRVEQFSVLEIAAQSLAVVRSWCLCPNSL